MASDIFAPPTKEELAKLKQSKPDIFAPPTQEEMAQIGKKEDEPWITGKGLLKGAVESLPVAGGLAGGALGLAGGPLGSVAGAGIGGAAGESIKRAVMPLLEGGYGKQPTELKELGKGLLETGKAGAEQAAGEATGQSLGALVNKFLATKSVPKAKEMASQIKEAAERLGTEATPGMLSEDLTLKGLESSLEQSPTAAGEVVRKQTQGVRGAMGEGVEGLLSDAVPSTQKVDVGQEIKKGLLSGIESRYKPIKEAYAELEPHMQAIKLNPKAQDAVIRNIMSTDAAKMNQPFAGQFASKIGQAENLNQLKLIRSDAIGVMLNDTSAASEKAIASDVIDKIDRMTERQATRAAIEITGQGKSKKLKDVFHGTFADFNPDDIRLSKRGDLGEGIYLHGDKKAVSNYGDKVLGYKIDPSSVADLSGEKLTPQIKAFAEKHGFNIENLENPKRGGNLWTRFVGETRALFPDEKLVGTDAFDRLKSMMRDEGFEGIRYTHNQSPDNYLIFEKSGLKKAPAISGEGKEIAKGLLETRKAANKAYKELKTDLEFISQRAGLGRGAEYGPETFMKQLSEKVTPEELPKKLFDLKDVELMNKFQKMFPEQFNKARQLRLGEILEASKNTKGEIQVNSFLRQAKGLSSQAIKSLFGADKEQFIKDIKLLSESMPEKIGPSGTPQGQMFINMIMSPKAEIKEFLRLKAYQGRGGLIGKPIPQISPQLFSAPMQAIPGLMRDTNGK